MNRITPFIKILEMTHKMLENEHTSNVGIKAAKSIYKNAFMTIINIEGIKPLILNNNNITTYKINISGRDFVYSEPSESASLSF